MIITVPPSARGGRPEVDPPDGILLRIALDVRRGTQIPPAPAGADITASFSCRAAAACADHVQALGYRCVGESPSEAAGGVAYLLVPQAVVDRHPGWWEDMAPHVESVFSLAFGPALAAFDDVLSLHRQPVH
ncbi:MAG TPA: hypothetical protein VM287_01270 [Egibacteraceae bacterium]|nr:hypothetical protein [Egibacteraceae bacterium]